jgi:hypothetical protein
MAWPSAGERGAGITLQEPGVTAPFMNRRRGTWGPPPPPKLHQRSVADYVPQQPEPQQPELQQVSCSPAVLPVGYSSTQHSHRHSAQSQVPVSQHLQQSHTGQPQFGLPSIAGTRGTKPSVAQRM